MKKVVFRKDVKQTRTLIKAARNSSKRAVIESKVLGLTITLHSLLPIVKDYFIWVSFFVIFSFIICYLIGRSYEEVN